MALMIIIELGHIRRYDKAIEKIDLAIMGIRLLVVENEEKKNRENS